MKHTPRHLTKEEYYEIKQRQLDAWRKRIFIRDGFQCVNCGNTKNLELAHITACITFTKNLKASSEAKKIIKSFSDDNLLTLCKICHEAQHKSEQGNADEETRAIARTVHDSFSKRIIERGWRTTHELCQNEIPSDIPYDQIKRPKTHVVYLSKKEKRRLKQERGLRSELIKQKRRLRKDEGEKKKEVRRQVATSTLQAMMQNRGCGDV